MNHTDAKQKAIKILYQGGIANPTRLVKLIREGISFFQLDLSGLTVLTEAASGPFVVTPIIAILGGASRVLALTKDSHYASAEAVIAQTRALEKLCDVDSKIEIFTKRSPHLFAEADIITNLGFVRPIDESAVAVMKSTAVIPLMCESWELRPGDVDLEACERFGIVVLGTNEDYPGLEVFENSGCLSLKILFDAGLEVYQNNLLIISNDKFGRVIKDSYEKNRANVQLIELMPVSFDEVKFDRLDAIIVADYTYNGVIIGNNGLIDPKKIKEKYPETMVIQFSGKVNIEELRSHEIGYYPAYYVGPFRMGKTFGYLGIKAVIDLHTAGLKVGEITARNAKRFHNYNEIKEASIKNPLCMGVSSK